ncbi:MAG: OmpA family protein [Bacteroidota bacterium]
MTQKLSKTTDRFKTEKICFFLLLLSGTLLAQKDHNYMLHAIYPTEKGAEVTEFYSHSDSLSDETFKKCAIGILLDGKNVWKKAGDMYLSSFEISIYDNGKLIETSDSWIKIQKKSKMPEKIVINKIKGMVKKTNVWIELDIPSIVFYGTTGSVSEKNSLLKPTQINYEGKLLTGNKEKKPLTNQKVILKNNINMEVQTSITDKYGDFNFKNVNPENIYKIEVSTNDNTIVELFMAKRDGTIVKQFIKSGNSFVYELLPTELYKLTQIKEEDPELIIRQFGSAKESELTILENIYFDLNSFGIKAESTDELDKFIWAMKQNSSLKISILSHTDSQGEDAYNLTLSNKRAQSILEYLVSKGIRKKKITAVGLGETKIMNRCINNIDCSEFEHQLNRRTEFKFSK